MYVGDQSVDTIKHCVELFQSAKKGRRAPNQAAEESHEGNGEHMGNDVRPPRSVSIPNVIY
jgi:hypothetical protein